jgi:murein DD-endopeptidase MepM/ murein hydrolase activator NlpD
MLQDRPATVFFLFIKMCYNINMKKIILILIPILILAFFLNVQNFVYGEDVNNNIKDLNKEIQAKKDEIKQIQDKQEKYSRALRETQSEKVSLVNQLAILDNRLAKSELDIEEVSIEIDVTNLEIKKIEAEIEKVNNDIEDERGHLSAILRLMRKQDSVGALEIILLNNNLSDFLNQVKYLESINSEVGDSLDSLKDYKDESEKNLASLDEKSKELNELKEELEENLIKLEEEQNTKVYVLDQTKSNEKEYQRLIELAKQEQAEASADIALKEKIVRERLEQLEGKELRFNDTGMIWPVPKNVITSYFHDPDYPFKFIFEHPAVDIRAGQGTILKAAASGYVARAKNGGKGGYSYIMIVHGDGIATVYGHVSKIYVEEDEYVVQGQTIGLTGGLPGTPGAGRLTTGPHLHFEVRLNGIPVNALEYLP